MPEDPTAEPGQPQDGPATRIAPDREPTLFEWAGGLPALTRMTRIFYGRYVPNDPLLAPLFAHMEPDHPERVAAWLGETLGGPKIYTDEYGGYPHMVSQHVGKGLTEAQRARWVSLLSQAADDAGLPTDPEFRSAFASYIEWGSRIALENSQPGARPRKVCRCRAGIGERPALPAVVSLRSRTSSLRLPNWKPHCRRMSP